MVDDICCTLDETLVCQIDDFMMLLLVFFIFLPCCLVLTNEMISCTQGRYVLVHMISWALKLSALCAQNPDLQVLRVPKKISADDPNSRSNATSF